ncbi:hypothetical protein CPB84DRAFT_1817922 [Gymnopilus junonius]|uniref:Kinase n=1 Tax=Gymnopilus junonius TaxID=109634 RepID=A0A9P5TH30_GYMJU|nr:hypothetical protein CPB84DRAFT_1817922 [Gymnopilus junonius]
MNSQSLSPSPTPGNHQPLTTQVAGHVGVMMTTEDGSLLIKPALPREVEFYQILQQDKTLEGLRVFTPQFLGTLKLEGQVDPSHANLAENIISIVLENLAYQFVKPNILDVKLGTVLYDDTATPEKKARMEKAAKDTTSGETGIRVTGFQVYDNATSKPIQTPKTYGKSLKPHQLGEGIAKFFPLFGQSEFLPVAGPTSGEDIDMSDSTSSYSFGLPIELLTPIVQGIREEVVLLREVYEPLEIRMIAASLLIIYEADWDRAEEALTRYFVEEDNEEDSDEEDDDDDETKPKKVGLPFVVRLIDFAHTNLVPGKGPDKGVLLGMETVINLLDDRLKKSRLEAVHSSGSYPNLG